LGKKATQKGTQKGKSRKANAADAEGGICFGRKARRFSVKKKQERNEDI